MTIFGWDMSHFDSPGIGTAVAEGIQFVTHKAGGDLADTELAAWWSGVKGQRGQLLVGAYWVLRPDLSGSAAAKADAFLARLDSQCDGWRDGPFLLQADCEQWGGDPATVPNKVYIQAFCDRLVRACPKLMPVVYAPKWVYGDKLAGLEYPLWASSYVTGAGGFRSLYPGDSSSRWATYSGQTPAILQFSSSAVIGGQTTSDANAYRGTLAELTALVAPGWSDDMPLTPDDLKAVAQAVWSYQFTRPDGPDSHGSKTTSAGSYQCYTDVVTGAAADRVIGAVNASAGALPAAVAAAIGQPDPAVLAQAIAAALPTDLAKQLVDELAQRLSA